MQNLEQSSEFGWKFERAFTASLITASVRKRDPGVVCRVKEVPVLGTKGGFADAKHTAQFPTIADCGDIQTRNGRRQ